MEDLINQGLDVAYLGISFIKKRPNTEENLCTESHFFGFRLGRGRYGNFFPNTIRGLALNYGKYCDSVKIL